METFMKEIVYLIDGKESSVEDAIMASLNFKFKNLTLVMERKRLDNLISTADYRKGVLEILIESLASYYKLYKNDMSRTALHKKSCYRSSFKT